MIRDKMKFELIEKFLAQNNYQIVKPIGHGSFGEVLLVTNKQNDYFAAKIISKAFLRRKAYLEKYIQQQCEIMAEMDHPNIVKNYKCLKSNHFLILINEYCNGGNLLKFQAKLPSKKVPLDFSLEIMFEVLKGIKAMHDRHFIHRDIKSENILVCNQSGNEKLTFKITDFGFARSIKTSSAKTLCGTEKFMAPEILSHQPYGEGVDVWSLGVVFYFILFGQFPFKGFEIKRQIDRRCKHKFQLSKQLKDQYNNEDLQNFFERVFRISKQERITISEIAMHPLFANYREKFIKEMNLQEHKFLLNDQEDERQQENLLDDPHSEMEAEDLTCDIIIAKQPISSAQKHLQKEIEEIRLEIDKIQYLKQSAQAIFETYRQYFFYSQRIAASYYLLNAALMLGKPLLNSLDKLDIPASLADLNIEHKKWILCTLSSSYNKQLDRLKELIIEIQTKYEDTYFYASRILDQIAIKNFSFSFSHQLKQKFQDIKISYRSTTSHLFSKLNTLQQIDSKLKVKMQMRIFCCHMINRIFNRSSVLNNFQYFRKWLVTKQIVFAHSFDFHYFRKWILMQDEEVLRIQLKILIDKYF